MFVEAVIMGPADLLMVLIVGGALGIIPARIASRKGHSYGLWWLFGALLFIVALPCAILIGPAEGSSGQEHTGEHTGMTRCPQCAEWIQDKAVVCRYCRYDFREASNAKNQDQPSPIIPPPPPQGRHPGLR